MNPPVIQRPLLREYLFLLPAVLLYALTTGFAFTSFDEQWMIVQNTMLKNPAEYIANAFTQPLAGQYYRPVFLLSVLLDFEIGGIHPAVYHVQNLLWHLFAMLALFRLLNTLKIDATKARWLTALYGLHPLMAHAVAWVPGRNDLMLTVFCLLSMSSLLRYSETKRMFFLLQHITLLILALLTKETAVVLPFALIGFQLFTRTFTFNLKLFTFWLIVLSTYLFLHHKVVQNNDLLQLKNLRLGELAGGLLLYIGKLLVPVEQSLVPTLRNSALLPGFVTICFIVLMMIYSTFSDRRLAVAGLFLFVITLLLPLFFSATKPSAEFYEHRAALPLAGFVIFLSQLRFKRLPVAASTLGYLFVFVFFMISARRVAIYKNEHVFITAGLKESPDFYLFHQRRADELFLEGRFQDALPFLNTAMEMRPGMANMHNARGLILYGLNAYNDAIEDFSRAIELSVYNDYYYLNRFLAYHKAGDTRLAMKDMFYLKKKCASILPAAERDAVTDGWVKLFDNVRARVELHPQNDVLQYELATMYYDIDLFNEARPYAAAACRIKPGDAKYMALAALLNAKK
jgi:protein O-mannosyl-transferase